MFTGVVIWLERDKYLSCKSDKTYHWTHNFDLNMRLCFYFSIVIYADLSPLRRDYSTEKNPERYLWSHCNSSKRNKARTIKTWRNNCDKTHLESQHFNFTCTHNNGKFQTKAEKQYMWMKKGRIRLMKDELGLVTLRAWNLSDFCR